MLAVIDSREMIQAQQFSQSASVNLVALVAVAIRIWIHKGEKAVLLSQNSPNGAM